MVQRQRSRLYGAALCAVLVIGAALRLETLDQRPLWSDELFVHKLVVSSASPAEAWARAEVADEFQHPPLFFAIAHATSGGEGGALGLRLPSVVAGIVSMALLAALGQVVVDRRTGLLAGFLLAISIYHVDSSQDARPYALSVALTLGQYLGFVAFATGRRRGWLVVFVVCGIASLHTYHLALLHQAVLGGGTALLVVSAARDLAEVRRAPLVVAWLAILIGFLPRVSQFLGFLGAADPQRVHVLDLSLRVVRALVRRWATGGETVAAACAALAALGSAVVALRSWAGLLLVGWVAAPFLLFGLVPFSKYFDARFLISALPVFYLWTAAGAVSCSDRVARLLDSVGLRAARRAAAALLLVFAAGMAMAAAGVYQGFRRLDVRCSDFVNAPEILRVEEAFCVRHLVLNSMVLDQNFLVRPVAPAAKVAGEMLERYAGRYELQPGMALHVARVGNTLQAGITAKPVFELIPESETDFLFRGIGWRIRFPRAGAGPAEELTLVTPEGEQKAPRIR